MALEKIRPVVVDETQNFVFNNVTATGNLTAANANLGNLAFANYITGTLTTSAQPNITSVGTLGNITVTSNVSAGNILTNNLLYANGSPWQFGGGNGANVAGSNTQVQFNDGGTFGASANFTFDKTTNTLSVTNFVGSGSGLSGLTGANVSGQVSNALVAGTVYTAAQPNITSVGTLTSLNVTGNLSSGNANLGNLVTANFFSGAGNQLSNIQGSNVTGQVGYAAVANSVAGSNVTGAVTYAATANAVAGANVLGQVGNALVAGTVYTAAQPNITSVGTLTSLDVTGNIGAGNVNGGNLVTANYLSGTLTTAAQPNITSVGTLSALTVSGNLSSGNANLGNLVVANFFQGDGGLLSNITSTNANFANFAGNVTGTAQANITSVGNLVGLTVSNSSGVVNFSNTANVTLGNVSNLHISGGSANYILKTDGSGNLSWVAQSGGASANIAIYDEGNLLTNTASSLNFVGNGVTATSNGNAITVTIDTGSSNVILDSFTGNGVQTVFTLSTTPSSINNTLVNIDGVSQLHDAYSLSGNSITFDGPPVNGAVIEVMTFNLGTGGGGGGITAQDLLSPFLLMGA